jgi:hypothetical protein
MTVIRAAALAVSLLAAPAHAFTWAEAVACKPEAVRLCDAGPADLLDYSRVATCMRQKWSLVSKACRDAVAAAPK